MCCFLGLFICSLWLPYAQPWEEWTHFACCSLVLACLVQTTTNTTYVLVLSFFFFFRWGNLASSACKASFNTWQTMNVRSFAGWCCIGLRFLSTCIIRYAVFFGRLLYLFHGRSRWAWDRREYGSVSACFLNLAICPLVPITLLLPDQSAEILIHMAEYYLQCCLKGNLKHMRLGLHD